MFARAGIENDPSREKSAIRAAKKGGHGACFSPGVQMQMQIGDPKDVREVHGDVVQALDAALHAMLPGSDVNHAFDPSRIVGFRAGGPPVWSIGIASHPSGVHQLLTYGLSRALDPRQSFGFELTMRVRSAGAALWAVFLLRALARYQLLEREIAPGDHIDLGGPISQAPMRPEDRATMPTTRMTTVVVLPGFAQPTPRGIVDIRPVYGLDPAARDLLAKCRPEAFCAELRRYDPMLTVDLDGASVAEHPMFRSNLEGALVASPGVPGKMRYIHFACGCGAKYATPADKMPAKTFRIACKRCKAVMEVPEDGRIINEASFPLIGIAR